MSLSSPPYYFGQVMHWLNRIPHWNYKMKAITDKFNLDPNGAYIQSLVVLCILSLLFALLLLFGIVIFWICQCCRKQSDKVRSRRHIRNLSTALFFISVVCFILLGFCLYGNEHTNKNVNSANSNLGSFTKNIRIAFEQTQKFNSTQYDASQHVDELTTLIEEKSKQIPNINQTLIREADLLITEVSDKLDDSKNKLVQIAQIFSSLKFLSFTSHYSDRIEFERWLICLVLITIMMVVLFAGVIAFCRQSRKGAIIFSGLGIVIFIVTWILFSIVFPITVAYADFCSTGNNYIQTKLNSEIIQTAQFYAECGSSASLLNLPPTVPVNDLETFYSTINENQHKLDVILNSIFNRSQEFENLNQELSMDIENAFKSIGALEAVFSCENNHESVQNMYYRFCLYGSFGIVLIALSLFLLGIFLFVLLIMVSSSWHIFIRSQSDYVEVGEEDHFSPRGQDSMPENVYDTNIFNPHARQIGGIAGEHSGSSNVTNLNGDSRHMSTNGLVNSSAMTPLLNDTSGTWLRGNGGTAALLASAPPAGHNTINSARLRNSNYQLTSNGHSNNYYSQPLEICQKFEV